MRKFITLALFAICMTASAQDNKVYTTPNGKKYHTHKDCGYIKNSDVKEVSKDKAEKDGKTICSRCKGKDNKKAEESK